VHSTRPAVLLSINGILGTCVRISSDILLKTINKGDTFGSAFFTSLYLLEIQISRQFIVAEHYDS
jgi:hypothetical protein